MADGQDNRAAQNARAAQRAAERQEQATKRAQAQTGRQEQAAERAAAATRARQAQQEQTRAAREQAREQRARDIAGNREDRRDARQDRRETAEQRQAARDLLRNRGRAERGDRDRVARVDQAEERRRREARAETRERVQRERSRRVAQRNERRDERGLAQLQQFRNERPRRVAQIREQRRELREIRDNARRRDFAREARREIREYWHDRAEEIRYRIDDRRYSLFDDHWWERRHWHDHPILVSNPWWWWHPAEFSTVSVFLDTGWSEPVYYDYGTDVIYDQEVVYVHGEPVGSPVEYSRQVIELANPAPEIVAAAPVDAPVIEEEWTPLGVWALVQEDQGDAIMFFQLSVSRDGLISGAYVNVVSGEELPVIGQVDEKTQRAAWHIGDQKERVFEAGMANLTQNEASCMMHLGGGEMQTWLLVRMESPDLPSRPADVGSTNTPVERTALNP